MAAALHPLAPLQNRLVMVVEDEFFQAKDLGQALTGAGASLVGPFPTVAAALEALKNEEADVDAAVLDINLRGCEVYEVADILAERGIPFLFTTGYDPEMVPQSYQGRPICTKPFRIEELLAAVAKLLAGSPAQSGQQQVQKLP